MEQAESLCVPHNLVLQTPYNAVLGRSFLPMTLGTHTVHMNENDTRSRYIYTFCGFSHDLPDESVVVGASELDVVALRESLDSLLPLTGTGFSLGAF